MKYGASDKLAVIQRLIEDFRWARSDPAVPEHKTYKLLKLIAVDMQAARRGSGGRVLSALKNRRQRIKSRPGADGAPDVTQLGQEVLAHWPVIERALQDFENREGENVRASDTRLPDRASGGPR
jgi:hypothetical protein